MTSPKPLRTALAPGEVETFADDLANLGADIIHVCMSCAGSLHWALTHFAAIVFVRTYFVRTDCSWRTPRAASQIPDASRPAFRAEVLLVKGGAIQGLEEVKGERKNARVARTLLSAKNRGKDPNAN